MGSPDARTRQTLAHLRRIAVLAADLDEPVRWSEKLGWLPERTGDGGSSANHQPYRPDAASGPVLDARLTRQRALVRRADKAIKHARHSLGDAARLLELAFGEGEIGEPDASVAPVSRRQLANAQRAQRRRIDRGEGWGEA